MGWPIRFRQDVPRPTLITYLGGSAGDVFAAGANGFEVSFYDREYVRRPPYSIKHLAQGTSQQINLQTVIDITPFDYLTTHVYDPLANLHCPTISLIISDPRAVELTVFRQMKIQTLTIRVDPNETAYRLIKNAVDRDRWDQAAQAWFAMAWKKWHKDQQYRIHNPLPNGSILHFDRLYHDDFVDSIRSQGFVTNLDLLEHNHKAWLVRNLDHDLQTTLQSMIKKLQCMDWTQQGYVTYDQS